ncbi:hypothetical protein VNO80_21725 [Phaseolus coccineus]|uniref:Uncharacterized protein n=1 Tax=Phaseolus coccineus TaxID=3886 RepID=A0AAN9M8K7_PHACN
MRRQRAVKDREEEERKQKVTYIVCGYDRGEMEEAVKDKKSSGKYLRVMFLTIVRVCLRLGCFSAFNFSRHLLPPLDSDFANSDNATITV